MSIEVMSSPRDSSHYEEKEKAVESIQNMSSTDDQGSITKDSGLVLLNNRYYCQDDSSDNKLTVIKKKPPPLFIDIQHKRNIDELHQIHNNISQQNTTIPLKSPTSSIRLMDLGPLDNDEQNVLEEDIRARRLARRQQHKRTYADDDDDEEESRTTIGTRVAEGHRNYQMMYDMLTGIRIAVGRVSAKIQRDLTPEDFTAAHKLVFDV